MFVFFICFNLFILKKGFKIFFLLNQRKKINFFSIYFNSHLSKQFFNLTPIIKIKLLFYIPITEMNKIIENNQICNKNQNYKQFFLFYLCLNNTEKRKEISFEKKNCKKQFFIM